jgi:isoleucyl-tRNA synthetase
MDYKETLNLPKTDFPMKADLVGREPQRLEAWQSRRLYQSIQARRAASEKFILHDGPPFANGDVHIGTAANKILKDIIVKYQTLRGKSAPYVPGWDCHGLPIEFKVVQELRKQGPDATANADPATIRKACEAYAKKFIDLQRKQFQRLGVLGDWDNPYLTFLPQYEADELRLFADLVEQGFVYRGKKPVYWSIPCRTALAEAEVEYQDHVSQSVYVKFPVIGRSQTYVVIWTTTPWTLPANLAIAYNSTFSYTEVCVDNEFYIVSVVLLPEIVAKCGWENYQIVRSLDAGHLEGVRCRHPFIDRTVPLLAGDDFVENTTGTGFVHVAPGHGFEDYHLGLRNGLPIYSPVDDDGCFCHTADLPVEQQMPASLLKKPILERHGKSEANEAVLQILREGHRLLAQENHTHSYPHCWRSKTPIIFRAMDQWFVKIDHQDFRGRALAAIDLVQWVPEWGKNRIEAAVKSRPDWCISRQRAWGVPIPAFVDAQGKLILEARLVRAVADLIEKQGSNLWFEKAFPELWSLVRPRDWTGPEPVAKATDTLDVWIDSGSSSRTVLMRFAALQRANPATVSPAASPAAATAGAGVSTWQADMYLEGSDQHRGWFQSSLLLSLAGNGAPPFRTVLTHGFMVDADREKISKSKQGQGGYEKPQTSETYIKKYGADVVRLWVASQDFRSDVIVSEERINKVSEIYRVIRNALRYQLSNLYDFDPVKDRVAEECLTGLDRWILEAYAQIEQQVAAAYDLSEFHVVYQRISQFVAVELSAIYHDVAKDRLYTYAAGDPRRRATQTVLHRMVTGLCQMLAPILSFTADEAWAAIPGRPCDSVHLSDWNPLAFVRPAAEQQVWQKLLQWREPALLELEKARQNKLIGKALEAKVTFLGPAETLPANPTEQEALRELLNISQITVRSITAPAADAPALTVAVARADGQKCGRCWHYETDVGAQVDHPTLCGRCVTVVSR